MNTLLFVFRIRCLTLLPLIVALMTACSLNDSDNSCDSKDNFVTMASAETSSPQAAAPQLKIKAYKNFAELAQEVAPNLDEREFLDSSLETCSPNRGYNLGVEALDGANPDGGVTNRQVQGVDQGDYVKVSDQQIFVGKSNFLEVLDRQTLQLQFHLKLANTRFPQLFFSNNKLVVYGDASDSQSPDSNSLQTEFSHIFVFQISGATKPELLLQQRLPGQIIGTRLKDSILSLVSQHTPFGRIFSNDSTKAEAQALQQLQFLPPGPIVRPTDGSAPRRSSTLTTVTQMNLRLDAVSLSSASVLENFSEVFAGAEGLYLIGNTWGESSMSSIPFMSRSGTLVLKIKTALQGPQVGAMGVVPGHTLGAWAFSEIQSHLIVATTTQERELQNHLFVLKETEDGRSLNKVASIENFGTTEDIRSVRYFDNKAYIVTFKKTDPLFIIDLAVPSQPQMLSELKAPGFSRYMHPLADNHLLGLGFAAIEDPKNNRALYQGIQLSLFNIQNPLQPHTVQQIEIGGRGSFSEVQFNHQGLYHHEDSGLVGFPASIVEQEDEGSNRTSSEILFSGALFYQVQADGIKKISEVSHKNWEGRPCDRRPLFWWTEPAESFDVDRIFELDNQVITLSRFGIRAHSRDNLDLTLKQQEFPELNTDCDSRYAPIIWDWD